MPDPDGYAQMDGPEEATRESARPEIILWPRKRGRLDEADNQILWLRFTGTLLPSGPINTPAFAAERAIQRRGD